MLQPHTCATRKRCSTVQKSRKPPVNWAFLPRPFVNGFRLVAAFLGLGALQSRHTQEGKLPESFDLFGSRAARDAALDQVSREDFVEQVLSLVANLPHGWHGTGEDVRELAGLAGIVAHHPNAWGAAINTCVRQKLLLKTDVFRQMRAVRSHARATRVYRRA